MTKKILITLKPADYYFFGGENTFDIDTVPGSTNYLVHSNLLPQQTAVIGLLRHILYLNKRPFGDVSFRADWAEPHPQEYGDLLGISPLFLQNGDGATRKFLLPAHKLLLADKEEITVDFENAAGEGFGGSDFVPVPKLEFYNKKELKKETYSYKNYRGNFWVDLEQGNHVPVIGIFISSVHIGIDKMSRIKNNNTDSNATDEEGFYKQEFYQLAQGYQFAVVAELADDVPIDIFNTTMPFGGESRTFCLHAEPWTEQLAHKWQPATAYGNRKDRIVLSSDAFVENPTDLFSRCSLVVADAKPFRNIQIRASEYSREAFANLHRKKRSSLIYLLERGTVLFPKKGEEDNIVNILNQARNFQNIGYNYFYPHQSQL